MSPANYEPAKGGGRWEETSAEEKIDTDLLENGLEDMGRGKGKL